MTDEIAWECAKLVVAYCAMFAVILGGCWLGLRWLGPDEEGEDK